MDNLLPIWALTFWTLGAPLVWAVVDLASMSKSSPRTARNAPLAAPASEGQLKERPAYA